MGYWGVTALDNDYALDWLEYNAETLWNEDTVIRLLDSDEEWAMLVGVAAFLTAKDGFKFDIWGNYSNNFEVELQSIQSSVNYNWTALVPKVTDTIGRLLNLTGYWLETMSSKRVEYLNDLLKQVNL